MIQKVNCRITGVAPLLMHNGRLADRDDEYARAMSAITSKRSKADSDYEELARLEFMGGLYVNGNTAPIIPGYVMEATLIGKGGAARKERLGKEAAAALYVVNDSPLIYEGPKTPKELWANKDFVFQALVTVQRAKIKRTRPIFRQWAADIEVEFNDALLDEKQVKRWVEVAGEQVGLMDWRPRFGRFEVEW